MDGENCEVTVSLWYILGASCQLKEKVNIKKPIIRWEQFISKIIINDKIWNMVPLIVTYINFFIIS
jgi:hypothetical protein